jgi:hypothetical protein
MAKKQQTSNPIMRVRSYVAQRLARAVGGSKGKSSAKKQPTLADRTLSGIKAVNPLERRRAAQRSEAAKKTARARKRRGAKAGTSAGKRTRQRAGRS